jgi:uncharacterized protein (DUF1501 family)
MRMTRREFVRNAGLGLSAYLLGAPFGRGARAQSCPDQKILFVVFLRGGADGVNLVIPRVDNANYMGLRPDIQIAMGTDLPLDPVGHFGLHPSLAALKPMYDAGDMAVVHAVGGTNRYSHFEAMDAMEFVAPGATPRGDGWLHAMLVALGAVSGGGCVTTALRGVSLAPAMISSMRGNRVPEPVSIALPSVGSFAFQGDPTHLPALYSEVSVYDQAGQSSRTARELVKVSSDSMHGAVAILESAAERVPASDYAGVPPELANPMRDAARLVKEPNTGIRALTVDFGGWDHHYFENSVLPGRASALAGALESFYEDIGPSQKNRVITLVVSEFGRTAFQNGTGGADHGYGNLMFVLGGGVHGGRVLSRLDPAPGGDSPGLTTYFSGELVGGGFPGLGGYPGVGGAPQLHVQESTNTRRDLKATTDFREVFAECMIGGLGMSPSVVHSGASLNDPNVVLGDYTPPVDGLGLFI